MTVLYRTSSLERARAIQREQCQGVRTEIVARADGRYDVVPALGLFS